MPRRPIYYDTETTGLKWQKDRIIELAGYDPLQGRSFQSFIHPGGPISPESTAIHNITDEMVKDAPNFEAVAKEWAKFCEGEVILVAHNNDTFDFPFLKAEFERAAVPFPTFGAFDSLKWARRYRPDLPRHTLQFLREVYGIPPNQAHRALDDVMILFEVMQRMLNDLDIETAHRLVYEPRLLHHMPFGKYQGRPFSEIPKHYLSWLAQSGALEKPDNELLKQTLLQRGLIPLG